MNNVSGPQPGKHHSAGDIWYNTTEELFYVFDGFYWTAVADDNMDKLMDTLTEERDDPIEAYERAMSIL